MCPQRRLDFPVTIDADGLVAPARLSSVAGLVPNRTLRSYLVVVSTPIFKIFSGQTQPPSWSFLRVSRSRLFFDMACAVRRAARQVD